MDEMAALSADSPWWLIAFGFFSAGIPVAVGVLRFLAERRNAPIGQYNESRRIDQERAALSHDQQRLFDQMRGQLEWQGKRIMELELDRDRGWDLARAWNSKTHDLKHNFVNYWIKDNPGEAWTYPDLPPLESLIPRNLK